MIEMLCVCVSWKCWIEKLFQVTEVYAYPASHKYFNILVVWNLNSSIFLHSKPFGLLNYSIGCKTCFQGIIFGIIGMNLQCKKKKKNQVLCINHQKIFPSGPSHALFFPSSADSLDTSLHPSLLHLLYNTKNNSLSKNYN